MVILAIRSISSFFTQILTGSQARSTKAHHIEQVYPMPIEQALEKAKNVLIGSPLSSQEMAHERIPKWKALAILSSDALSSVAYATEEILIPLSLFATAAMVWSMPIALAVGFLLFILTLSYRQTIDAYPGGGGAYTVAKENIGVNAGLVAGGALLIDYLLTVAVSVSSGVSNILSAFPHLEHWRIPLCILVIVLLTWGNLRGIRESSDIFAYPTYFFIFSILLMLIVGTVKMIMGYDIPKAPIIHETYTMVPLFLVLKAFSSGCSALTGVEAISNGIPLFRKPAQENAKITMVWMSAILGFFFLGITLLAHVYGIRPSETETVISSLSSSVFGKNFIYYTLQVSVALILLLAANTSYAGFPWLASMLSKDGYLPRQLASLGDRLVFSNGIIGLSLTACILIIVFKGDTHLLIPLYAVGVFLSFTLSQTGMILYHLRRRLRDWPKKVLVNLIGALTTGTALVVIGMTKFTSGAWIVIILIPFLIAIFLKIHHHYMWVRKRLSDYGGYYPAEKIEPINNVAIVPISGIHPGVVNALKYACTISKNVKAVYVDLDESLTEKIKENWKRWAPGVELVVLESPYRSVLSPLVKYIDEAHEESRCELISIVIPEFITPHWYQQFMHNQMTLALRTILYTKRGKVVTRVRYQL